MGWTGQAGTGTHVEIDEAVMGGWTMADGTAVTMTDCRLVNFSEHYHVIRHNGAAIVIAVTMIQRYRAKDSGYFAGEPEWTYKNMTEDMGPVIHACPLDLLDLVPEPVAGEQFSEQSAQWAQEWRQTVREYHAKKAAATAFANSLKPGARIRIANGIHAGGLNLSGTEGTVLGKKGRKVLARLDALYGHIRLSPQHIAAVI